MVEKEPTSGWQRKLFEFEQKLEAPVALNSPLSDEEALREAEASLARDLERIRKEELIAAGQLPLTILITI